MRTTLWKNIITAVVFIVSTISFGCPKIVGDYKCTIGDNSQTLNIKQDKESITLTGKEKIEMKYILDGKTHKYSKKVNGQSVNVVYTARCEKGKVKIDGDYETDGAKVNQGHTIESKGNKLEWSIVLNKMDIMKLTQNCTKI